MNICLLGVLSNLPELKLVHLSSTVEIVTNILLNIDCHTDDIEDGFDDAHGDGGIIISHLL